MSTVEFTEEMKGHITLGEADYRAGALRGKADGNFFMFHLTITAEDIDAFVDDPNREASAEGYVSCEVLGGKLPVERGIFNLFVDTTDPDVKHMLYRLFFSDGVGHPLTMSGFKLVRDDPGLDLWPDTSTLYIHIFAGHVDKAGEAQAEIVASGVLTIYLRDFAKQLTTFRSEGGSLADRANAIERFGRLFMGDLWEIYGGTVRQAVGAG
jgi:hypothetical protein